MSIDRDIFEIVIENDSIKCLKYIYKNYINLYDLYLNNAKKRYHVLTILKSFLSSDFSPDELFSMVKTWYHFFVL